MSEIIGEGVASRFYKAAVVVSSEDSFGIELDGRVLKTPLKKIFLVPASSLADAVVKEWNAQGDKIFPRTMPLTSLANAAIDRIAPDPQHFSDQLVDYARSDLLCYWAESPDDLVQLQRNAWQPILDWTEGFLKEPFVRTSGIIPIEQPEQTLRAICHVVESLNPFYLTALIDLASRMSSVLLALAVWQGRLSAEEAFDAAFLDDIFHEQRWGEDSEATQRRSVIHAEIRSTAEFLTLLDAS